MKRFNVILLGACILVLFACAHQSNLTEEEKLNIIVDIVKDLNSDVVDMPETVYQEGYLNIIEVMNTWESGPKMGSIGGMPVYGFINPNIDEDIQYVVVVMYMGMPVGYVYLLQGEPYGYFIDKLGNFKLRPETNKEQWKSNFKMLFGLTDG